MPVLALGEDRVRKLQHELGGQPPTEAGERAAASMNQFLADRRGQSQWLREHQAAIRREALELLLGHLRDDPLLARLAHRSKALAEERHRQKYPFRPIRRSAEAAIKFGSDIWIKEPPYDQPYMASSGGKVTVRADNAGNYSIGATTLGNGYLEGAAGFGTWYYSPYTDRNKRFSVLLEYDDNWWDSGDFVTASNFLATRLWIWGARDTWVQKTDTGPSQNDSVGWLDNHSGDPAGTIALETRFDAQSDSWYQGFIWSDAHVDSGWAGPFGFSSSQINYQARVPFIVFATESA